MNGPEESDEPVVPRKPANKDRGAPRSAEPKKRKSSAKGNPGQQNGFWAQDQDDLQSALDRIRQRAEKEKGERFTSLWHHVYNVDRLRKVFLALRKDGATGVDGETWQHYAENLEENLQDLAARLKRGAYKARPVRRVYIPKADGKQRPLGIPTLEDKLVQSTVAEVLTPIYEADFLGFSYGFRPGRSQHNALDALAVALERKRVNWVLDADMRAFFDTIDHAWMAKFLEHRIADERVVRHVQKWLKAGVLEEGKWRETETGTPQGGSVSPLLANIYLHYALDLWVQLWRRTVARGEVIFVRYADDFVAGFQYEDDAKRFQSELGERLAKFKLELHQGKTALIEFGRFAAENRRRRNAGKPKTFDFLGFTHICGTTRKGRFALWRYTARKKRRASRAAGRRCSAP